MHSQLKYRAGVKACKGELMPRTGSTGIIHPNWRISQLSG